MKERTLLNEIIEFKIYLEKLKGSNPKIDTSSISKLLVLANMAKMVIYSNTKIYEGEKYYFDRQAAVGRYFCDLGEDYVAEMYLKICTYVKQHHW